MLVKTITALLLVLLISLNVYPQAPEHSQKEAMDKLGWLTGEWKGTAWTQMGPNNRDTVFMHETITCELNGTILHVRGTGYSGSDMKEKAHDAFAVISFDPALQKYKWQSWRVPGGYYTEYNPEITENSLAWVMETPRGKMRYHLKLNDKGQWHEVGEFSRDGENWAPFLEMILDKQ